MDDRRPIRVSRRSFCALLACSALPVAASSTEWPGKSLRILVPGGTGGVIDLRARWLADHWGARVGVPIVVDNRAGAGGLIGMEIAARSPADGSTLVMIHQGTMVVNPFVYSKLPYDPLRDFTPITRLGIGSLVLTVNPSLGVQSVAELVALGKAREKPLAFGSPGIGTPPHLAVELFKRETGMPALHIPYRGGGAAAADLLGSQIDFEIEGVTVLLPHIRAGRLRALATTGEQRVESLPGVPTMREAGVANYVFHGWVGIAVPAGTPPDVVNDIYRSLAEVLDTAEAREWFASTGAEPGVVPPAEFAASIRAEYAEWGRVIRDAGIHLQ